MGSAQLAWDSAKIWASSLALPGLANQVHRYRRADLDSRTGRLMALFYCSQIIAAAPGHVSPVHDQATNEAARLIEELG